MRPVKFLVVGMARSGTTLAQRLLTDLDRVWVPPETHFWRHSREMARRFPPPLGLEESVAAVDWFLGRESSQGLPIDTEQVVGLLDGHHNYLWNLFEAVVDALSPAQAVHLGEKTPDHAYWSIQFLRAIPSLVVVGLIRDPREVFRSQSDVPWGISDPLAFAEKWVSISRALTDASSLFPGRVLIVRYEDLIVDPEATMKAAADLIGLEFSLAQAEGSIGQAGALAVPGEWWKSESFKEVRATEDRWREEVPPEAVAAIEGRAQREMLAWGYEPETDGPSTLAVEVGADVFALRKKLGESEQPLPITADQLGAWTTTDDQVASMWRRRAESERELAEAKLSRVRARRSLRAGEVIGSWARSPWRFDRLVSGLWAVVLSREQLPELPTHLTDATEGSMTPATGSSSRRPAEASVTSGGGARNTPRSDFRPGSSLSSAEAAAEKIALAVEGLPAGQETFVLGFHPVARLNPYQRLLYGRAQANGFATVGLERHDAFESLAGATALGADAILHLHWTSEVLARAQDEIEAESMSKEFLDRLRNLKVADVKLVWTVHNVLPHHCPFPRVESSMRSDLVDLVDVVHVMSPGTSTQVSDYYELDPKKTIEVPHPSYLGAFPGHIDRQAARVELGFSPSDLVVGSVGSIQPYKGLVAFAEATRSVVDSDPNFRVVIAGLPGRDPASKSLLSLLHEMPHIRLMAHQLSDLEIATLMTGLDVMVLAYDNSLNSGAAMLAVTFGVPTIAPAIGDFVHLAELGLSRTYEPGSSTALAELLGDVRSSIGKFDSTAANRFAEEREAGRVSDAFFGGVRAALS